MLEAVLYSCFPQPGEESVDKLVDEAREVFTGPVYAADDLWTFNIPLHKT